MARVDGHDGVYELARVKGGRIRTLNRRLPGLTGGAFDLAAQLTADPQGVTAATNGEWITLEVEGSNAFVLAVGQPDRILAADDPLREARGLPLFSQRWASDNARRSALSWAHQQGRALAALQLHPDEGLVVAENMLLAVLRSAPVGNVATRLDALLCVARSLPTASAGKPDPGQRGELLPGELRGLEDLAATWAVDDDEKRSELIDAATDSALEDLHSAVAPHLGVIDALFDAAPDPRAPGLLRAGRLAEAAIEAQIELAARQKNLRP